MLLLDAHATHCSCGHITFLKNTHWRRRIHVSPTNCIHVSGIAIVVDFKVSRGQISTGAAVLHRYSQNRSRNTYTEDKRRFLSWNRRCWWVSRHDTWYRSLQHTNSGVAVLTRSAAPLIHSCNFKTKKISGNNKMCMRLDWKWLIISSWFDVCASVLTTWNSSVATALDKSL